MVAKRMVAAVMGNGHIGLIEQDIPPLRPGTVLVEVRNSLVSPGTELQGWRGLRDQLAHPRPGAKPRPFGYSNAGVVREVGEGVSDFRAGDRVACIGGGYALHSDHAVVPHHLCVPLPGNVTFVQGSYAMLAATALHAVRRGEPELGEFVAVVGLGIVGQLTARLYQLAGCYVIGWDTIPFRVAVARRWGIDAAVACGEPGAAGACEDEASATKAFTGGAGLDAAVFAFGGDAKAAYEKTLACLKCSPDGHRMGRIILVGAGWPTMTWTPANIDVRTAARTGAGYHDEAWEVGPGYPPVFMRWTTRTNLQLCMRLIAEGKLDVGCLTTHTIRLAEVDAGVSAIIGEPDKILGVVFEMEH